MRLTVTITPVDKQSTPQDRKQKNEITQTQAIRSQPQIIYIAPKDQKTHIWLILTLYTFGLF